LNAGAGKKQTTFKKRKKEKIANPVLHSTNWTNAASKPSVSTLLPSPQRIGYNFLFVFEKGSYRTLSSR
jgi:hypothetical protein